MPDITITDSAQKKIATLLNDNENKYLRISIQGIGWGGPRFGLTLDELNENDEQVEISGIKLLFKTGDAPYLERCSIDYLEDAFRGGFSVSANPQYPSNCCWLVNGEFW